VIKRTSNTTELELFLRRLYRTVLSESLKPQRPHQDSTDFGGLFHGELASRRSSLSRPRGTAAPTKPSATTSDFDPQMGQQVPPSTAEGRAAARDPSRHV
jgi:hypothetical protein